MILSNEQGKGRITDHRCINASDNKQMLIGEVSQLFEQDKAVISFK